jgi:hypothetical protein
MVQVLQLLKRKFPSQTQKTLCRFPSNEPNSFGIHLHVLKYQRQQNTGGRQPFHPKLGADYEQLERSPP